MIIFFVNRLIKYPASCFKDVFINSVISSFVIGPFNFEFSLESFSFNSFNFVYNSQSLVFIVSVIIPFSILFTRLLIEIWITDFSCSTRLIKL